MDWTTLADIATVVEAAVVLTAAIYGWRQLREMLKARHLQATIELIGILGSDEVARDRRAAFQVLAQPADASEDEWSVIQRTSYAFNRVGLLLIHGLLDKDILLDMYCETIIGAWDKLGPYIVYAREMRTFRRWQEQFEKLAEQAAEYARRHDIVGT